MQEPADVDATQPSSSSTDPARRAYRLINVALGFYLFAVAVASPFDIWWHTRHTFETFWSPPHLLLYFGVLMGAATVGGIAANRQMRPLFGPPLPWLPPALPLPAPLVILGAGFTTMIISGGFDNIWHTTWGQNETRWSYPHGLVAWGVFVTALGFVACRLALKPTKPITRLTAVGYGLLVFAFSLSAFAGPMAFNLTPETDAAVSAMPGFWGPDTQQLMRMIARWTLDRTNLFFPMMAAAWASSGLAIGLILDRRTSTLLISGVAAMAFYGAVGLAWAFYTGLLGSPSAWVPLPLVAVVITWWAARRASLPPAAQWAVTGLSAAMMTVAIYNPSPAGFALALLGAPAGAAAGILGTRLGTQLESPTPRGVGAALILMCVVLPAVFGTLDLYLRWNS